MYLNNLVFVVSGIKGACTVDDLILYTYSKIGRQYFEIETTTTQQINRIVFVHNKQQQTHHQLYSSYPHGIPVATKHVPTLRYHTNLQYPSFTVDVSPQVTKQRQNRTRCVGPVALELSHFFALFSRQQPGFLLFYFLTNPSLSIFSSRFVKENQAS